MSHFLCATCPHFSSAVYIRDGERPQWQNGDARAVLFRAQQFFDGRADVVAGRQVRGAHHFVGKRTVDQHGRFALNQRLDLRLPLFGSREARRGKQGQDRLRPGGAAQQLIERAAGGHTFAALAGQDDCPARLDDARRGAHALDALIQIQVERIAAVGGDNDVERGVAFLHGRLAHELAAGFMRRDQVAGKDAGDLDGIVERDIEQETRPDASGDVAQFLPQPVAGGDAERGGRVADVARAVIAHDGLQPGNSGHDAFDTATEPSEDVRLDEPGDDADVGLDGVAVDERGRAVAGRAQLDKRVGILRLVVQHAVIPHDGGRQHLIEFGAGVEPVRAELVEQRDVFARHVLQIIEQPRNETFVRRGARDVGEQDAYPVARLEPLAQRARADRAVERREHRATLVGQARRVRGLDDRRAVVGQFDGQVSLSVGQVHFHKKESRGRVAPSSVGPKS